MRSESPKDAVLGNQVKVLYRDARVLVVAKPSGMVVHRGWGQDGVTVADVVRDSIVKAPVHAVHRLDRGTSGVLLFALDAEAARQLQAQFISGSVLKRYICLVRGPMSLGCVCDHPVPRREGGERVPALTEFEPLSHQGRWSLVQATPRTGRLHQIRRHLKHLSHPIVGDVVYGKGPINRFFRDQYQLHRLALHALEVSFSSPDGQFVCVQAPMPADLAEPLKLLAIWPANLPEDPV